MAKTLLSKMFTKILKVIQIGPFWYFYKNRFLNATKRLKNKLAKNRISPFHTPRIPKKSSLVTKK